MKIASLVIINDGERVLLGMKKRGFGEGLWNGFGGKIEPGETMEQAAKRELREEAGIIAHELREAGIMEFSFEDDSEGIQVHVFSASSFIGEPKETEEMRPQWFYHADIPFGDMWEDDEYWFPHFLGGAVFRGAFKFKDTHTLLEYDIQLA